MSNKKTAAIVLIVLQPMIWFFVSLVLGHSIKLSDGEYCSLTFLSAVSCISAMFAIAYCIDNNDNYE